jgi:transcriptional regulator with GAF, ATPase, and Fis domain
VSRGRAVSSRSAPPSSPRCRTCAPSAAPPSPLAFAPLERYRDAKAAAIAEFDRAYLTRLLSESANNVSEAARRGRMDRPYLSELLKRYGLK